MSQLMKGIKANVKYNEIEKRREKETKTEKMKKKMLCLKEKL